MPLQGRSSAARGGHIPQPHGLVLTRRGEGLAVGAEGDAIDTASVCPSQGRAAGLAGWPRPTAARSCPRLAEARVLPSGLKATLSDRARVPLEGAQRVSPVATSHSRTVLSSPAGGEGLAVGAEGDAE